MRRRTLVLAKAAADEPIESLRAEQRAAVERQREFLENLKRA